MNKFDKFFVTYGWLIILIIIAAAAIGTFQTLQEQERNSAPIIKEITCETTTNMEATIYNFNQNLTVGRYRLPEGKWKNMNCTRNNNQMTCDLE